MNLIDQLREEAETAALDVDAGVFVFGVTDLEHQLLEQRARAKFASYDALAAQQEAIAERTRIVPRGNGHRLVIT